MRRFIATVLAGGLLIATLGAAEVAARTRLVACGRGDDLQAAIDRASRGDRLIIRGTCQGRFRITRDLTLLGAGSSATLLGVEQEIGAGAGILTIGAGADVVVRDMTLTGNSHDGHDAGGITNDGRLTLRRVLISDNWSHDIGGILNRGRLRVYDSVTSNNRSYNRVSGILNSGHMEVFRSYLRDGTSERGTHLNTGTLKLMGSTVTNLGGGTNGHGFDNRGRLVITASELRWSPLGTQGAMIRNDGSLRLSKSRLRGGLSEPGGAILNAGTAKLFDSTISGSIGLLGDGGAIFNGGLLLMRRSTLQGNRTEEIGSGGAIYNGPSAMAVVDRSTIRGNGAAGDGGGILNAGELRLRRSRIYGNEAAGEGGGIRNLGTLQLARTRIWANIPDDCVGC